MPHALASSMHCCQLCLFRQFAVTLPHTTESAAIGVQATATMFAVMNGFIIATILSSASSRHRYKERMDMIMVRSSSPSPLILLLPLCIALTLVHTEARRVAEQEGR